MSVLLAKQQDFAHMQALLILHAEALGYRVTLGHATRCEDCPVGHPNSLHKKRLAIDINLFDQDGVYLSHPAYHEELGLYWESIGGTWGGRFNDANHYSLEHDGMK